MNSTQKNVTIYTDGACIGNPGPGGYAAVLVFAGQTKEISGGFRWTTNNRMELTAAIAGLDALKEPCRVRLYSDSKYLVENYNSGAAARWKARGWMRTASTPALNVDLWERLFELFAIHEVSLNWVQGHAGNPLNERCDRLSTQAARRKDLPSDPGYAPPRGRLI